MKANKSNRQEALEKKVLETNLEAHVKYFFKKQKNISFTWSKYHKIITDAFTAVLDGKIKNLLILVPPRHSKTLLAKYFCSMGFARNPASEFIYACSDVGLALDCSSEIREVIASEEFKKRWPISIKVDTKAKGLWKTDQGGSFWAGGFGSPIVGYGAGKLPQALKDKQYRFGGATVVDDPLKEQDRHRSLILDEMWGFFKSTLPTRKNSPQTPTVMIMQPLHNEDPGQMIKKHRSKDFTIIELPIITDEGKPLFPEVYTLEDLEALKKEIGSEMWAAKCMLSPITPGGNILKTDFLKYYKELPFLKYRWIEADTAQKVEEKHDYTVFQCWGKGYNGGIYLIDQFRSKVKFAGLKTSFKEFWSKHNDDKQCDPRRFGYLRIARIEDKASGTQLIQEIENEANIPFEAVQRPRGKYERAVDACVPKLESGYINFPEDAPYLLDLKAEMKDFTGKKETEHTISKIDVKKRFDDQVDCVISACEYGFSEIVSDNDMVKKFIAKKSKRKR